MLIFIQEININFNRLAKHVNHKQQILMYFRIFLQKIEINCFKLIHMLKLILQ